MKLRTADTVLSPYGGQGAQSPHTVRMVEWEDGKFTGFSWYC